MKRTYIMKHINFIIFFTLFFTLFFIIILSTPSLSSASLHNTNHHWLSLNIYHEARGESFLGQFLVGLVTLDRVDDGRWGNTVKEVVQYPNQFSWVNDRFPNTPQNKKSWDEVRFVAFCSELFYAIFGEYVDLLYYHTRSVKPIWTKRLHCVLTEGNHIFYNEIEEETQ